MRTRFGPEDEESFHEAQEALVESYRAASEGRDDAPDGFVANVMLDYKWGYRDGRIAEWHRYDIEDLLLGHFPRKVTVEEDDLLMVVPEVNDFLAYLDRQGLLSGDPLPSLREQAAGLVPEFVDAMHDTTRFGMAKRLFSQMDAEGVDIEEQGSIDRWLEGFNARDIDERDDILGWPELSPAALPPIELPSTEELERAALATPVLTRLTAFAHWVGTGRKLTQQGFLTLADGKVLVETLDTGDMLEERFGERVIRPRSTSELPVLDLTFRWARAAGFVKVRHGRVSITRRGKILGAKPLEDWGACFEGLLKLESAGPRRWRRYGPFFDPEIGWLCERLPFWLYERPELELERLKDAVWAGIEADYYLSPDEDIRARQRRMLGYDVDHVLARFTELGAISVMDAKLSLTPLGLWATNRSFKAHGVIAPIAGEYASASASELLAACATMPLDIAEQEMRSWIEARPGTAAADLGHAARSGTLPMMALHALTFAGPEAEEEVRALLDVPVVGAQAQLWLVAHGYVRPDDLSPEVMQAVLIETIATQVDADGPVSAVAHFQGLGPDAEQIGFLERLLRAEHPRTSEILDIIGRYHPSKPVAKAARKTAFKRQAIHRS